MNREQLQNIFRSAYDAQVWQELLINLFGASDIRQTPSQLESDTNEKVEGFQLGTLTTNDRYEIGLFAFEIKGGNLKLNRVGLRSLVKSYTRYQVDAALVVYYDNEHWRLSFICDLKDEKTAPKRFTYVFGNADESYRTAADRLSKLIDTKPTFEAIKDAFSVEKLSKDFFDGYRARYGKFCDFLGKDQKSNRDYVKKMMGRLVFLQFLQKKGWMNGDHNYMQNLFANSAYQSDFLKEVLKPLFFHVLNTKENERTHAKLANLGTEINIPYLNGGLFETDDNDKKSATFDAELFADLFDFFSHYNFTIDENDPNDAEVGIDPEMLGHIFENLLEDNKDKGAFYTPKEIVQYMCRQSLIEYLQSKLGKHEAIATFVNTHNAGVYNDKNNFIAKNASKIGHLLDEVKVCDPAIGSGAFPMGMLNEIFHCKMALNMEQNRAEVKKRIIQNNIFGVDIEQGAVDIARLRFWLSLVVDEDEPQPLPNLDYKIMCGNSLLSRHALDISIDEVFEEYNSDNDTEVTLEDFKLAIREYTNTSDKEKKEEFRAFINDIKSAFKTTLDDSNLRRRKKLEQKITDLRRPNLFGEPAKEDLQRAKELEKSLAKLLNEAEEVLNNKLYENAFEWRFEFPQLLDDDGNFVGFDIVIGNPPYIQLQANGGALADQLKNEKFETFARTGDIYCVFYERGLQVLREGGIECYITSNKWMRAGYGEKLREFLVKNNPLVLLDLGAGVFESATVDTNILIVQRGSNRNELLGAICNGKDIDKAPLVPMTVSGEDIWTILSPMAQSIKSKIESIGTPLKDWDIEIYRGVLTGYNDAFIIDTPKRNELVSQDPRSAEIIKPILRGRDIKRYSAQWAGLWLINSHNGVRGKIDRINIEDYPAIKSHLDNHIEKITKRQDQGDTVYNLRNCAYLEEFEKEKIVYPETTQGAYFYYDTDKKYLEKTTFFMTGENLKFINGLLSSSLFSFAYKQLFASVELGTSGYQYNKHALIGLPLPRLSKEDQQPFIDIVDKILEAKKADPTADTTALESQIDQMVYTLYNLTPDEIAIIEK